MNKSRWAAVTLCVLISMWGIHFAARRVQSSKIKGHIVPAVAGPSSLVRSLRPNYPYSVIAGGAYSPGELRFADDRDAVVRAHYANFDMGHAKMVRLTDDRFQYVSYRIKNQVYWTKKKLRIPKGELLLTDGESFARARCGNRLAADPQAAVNVHEPDPRLLSLPPVNRDLLPKLALANPPALGDIPVRTPQPGGAQTGAVPEAPLVAQPLVPLEPVWGGQPIVGGGLVPGTPLVPTGGTPSEPGTPTTPVLPPDEPPPAISPVPEPDTIYLFLISLGISIWALLRISAKDEPDA